MTPAPELLVRIARPGDDRVGEAMVRWCAQRALADGRERIRIHTLESMPAAHQMYLRLGFVRDAALDGDWEGIVGLAFVLHLRAASAGV